MRIKGQNGFLNHGQFSTQGCVDIQPTKIFTDLGQFCVDAAQRWGYEIESTRSSSCETSLDVLHELPTYFLERIDTEGTVFVGLARDLSL
jgi:hypothetical protein